MQLQTSYVEDVHGPSSPSQGVRMYLVAFMGISVEEANDRLVLEMQFPVQSCSPKRPQR